MPLQVDQLRNMAAQLPDEVAYVRLPDGEALTFAAWDDLADRAARGLVERGVGRGDRVAILLENDHLHRWIATYAAVHRAAAVAVPLNTRLAAPELAAITAHCEPALVVTSTTLAGRLDRADPGLRRVTADDETGWAALTGAGSGALPDPPGDDDLADIVYTSGTTGRPKGIAVRHRNTHMVPNGEPHWTGEAWLHASPLFSFAGTTFTYNPMKLGMTGLYIPRFDAATWIDAVEAYRPTCTFIVPAMVELLLASDRFETADLSSLQLVAIGSAPLPPSRHRAVAERLPGASVSNSYSMTEAGMAYTFLPPGEIANRPGSVGMPVAPTEIRIADPLGDPMPPGEVGEVLIKVGEHPREYYNDPDATAATWADGWLHSGDLGRLDADGYLYIVGRAKDVIIRGGYNIAATEVEAVLYEHPAVHEAAVVGVDHAVLGQAVGAFVALRPGAAAEACELRDFCAERLADYKVPQGIWFVDALPRNAVGKVLKRDLRPPAR